MTEPKKTDPAASAKAPKANASVQPDATSARAATTDMEKKIDELTAQVAKLTDIASRAQAELQNAKIRLDRDAVDIRKFAAESVLRKLLPTIDNFQRAFRQLPDAIKNDAWVKGVASIEQDLIKQVTDMGLKKFESLSQSVDATKHETLMEGPGEEGKVVEVFEDGYELHGKVIRPAKVKVGAGNSSAPNGSGE